MDELIKTLKEYFSNPDNRQKVLNFIKMVYKYIRNKIPLQTTILYIVIISLMFVIIFRFNIDAGYIIKKAITAVHKKVTSINKKTFLAGMINKKEVADTENKILLSDGFFIEPSYSDTELSDAYRLSESVHIINNPRILDDEYVWIGELNVDKDKCKMLFNFFSDSKVNCITKTVDKKDTAIWINDCPMIKSITETALKYHIAKNENVLLLCGIQDSENFFYLYIGENYNVMQEFKNTVFLEKIVPIFGIKKRYIDKNI